MAIQKIQYRGNCQCCGRDVAVSGPKGIVSAHGYTLDYGFFNGTCQGTHKEPMQNDNSATKAIVEFLLKKAEEMDENKARGLKSFANDLAKLAEQIHGQALRIVDLDASKPEPINLGDQRKCERGVLTVTGIQGGRVRWVLDTGRQRLLGWDGTAKWRRREKLPVQQA
jgi:hypothetical protein